MAKENIKVTVNLLKQKKQREGWQKKSRANVKFQEKVRKWGERGRMVSRESKVSSGGIFGKMQAARQAKVSTKGGRKAISRVMQKIAGTSGTTRKTATGSSRGVGRPTGTYRLRVNPFTGQLIKIDYWGYDALKRRYNNLQRAMQEKRMMQMQQPQQMPMPQNVPPQMPQQAYPRPVRRMPQQMPMQPQQQYRVVVDLMTGRKMLKPIPPRERWTM